MLVDTHAHIYNNVKEILKRANLNGVKLIVNCSEDYITSKKTIKLSKKYINLFSTVGIHPLNVDKMKKNDLKKIELLIKNNKIIAIGEIGLDYYYSKENKNNQIELFKYQLELANKYNLPVIIHTRDAHEDTINILKKYRLNGVIHCFSSSIEIAKEYLKLGYYLGIGGVITFKNSKLSETIKKIPINSILLETDSPFLSPEPFRGLENEPKNIPIIAKKIAEDKNLPFEELEKITTLNAKSIFDI